MKFLLEDDLLKQTKAEFKKYYKGDIIFSEGECSQFFHYLKNGELSVSNLTEKGKELLQHKVKAGSFFAEPAVLLGVGFPGNVEVCTEKAEIIKIPRDNFITYLKENPEVLFNFTLSVANKSIKKSQLLKQIVLFNPEDRITQQLEDFKREMGQPGEKVLIQLTRKDLAHMTGLRIETVIRTIKKMEKEQKLEIVSGKIIY
ncbi:Crp/Fnr family transcriptional regulator [Kaistella daneshvariae]|jgi:CRP-like cAMP-binding protein|uniref:Crp/Fnr family transcriptional regulator n=1 Tax=Kaistella daneshvariae TaxID=2487074 RepID=A0ABM7C8W7_9FLAO|nr:Crp/Fnr family transcriptional regulator [Kaistella daneshvariae]AZI67446.1 Crp/Fnr family transcriptional regulator [Kaistella daneshvariae]